MGRKARVVTAEQQIQQVQEALLRLRRAKRFIGQEAVIQDTVRQLAILKECHRQGRLEPISED